MQFHGKEQKISQNKLMYLYIYTYIIWLIFSVSLSAMQNEWLPFNSFVRPSVLSQSPTRSGFDLEFSVSNYLKAMDTNLPTYINIDYEKYTTILSYRRDFYDTFWMTVSLPFYVYSGGFLDSTISGWHNFWGLPNSDHDHVNNNQFSFRLKSDGVTYVNLTEAPLGFGDLSFYFFGHQSIGEVILTPIVLITLPTGDEDQLLGTGQVSGAMGLRLSRLWCGINFDVQGYLRLRGCSVFPIRWQQTFTSKVFRPKV